MTKYGILQTLCIISILSHSLVANLTTLQWNDPSPYYSASNNLMPANNQIVQQRKAQQKNLRPDNDFHITLNFSGLVQGACRARSCSGCIDYGSQCDDWGDLGTQMGDFRGTIYAMGLFLGDSPNGKSIWANGIANGDITNIVPDSINNTQLPSCLKNIAKTLSGNYDQSTGVPTPSGATTTFADGALMFNPQTTSDTYPSIFTPSQLATDPTFFGAFSLPLNYRKNAFRFELGAEFGTHVALTIQAGVSNIKQTTTGLNSISSCYQILPGCTTVTNTNGTNTVTGGQPTPEGSTSSGLATENLLYSELNFLANAPTTPSSPNTAAQLWYDQQISQNTEEIFGPCGINQSLCNFDNYSIEDLRAILTIKNTYDLDRYTRYENSKAKWPEMLFTPYAWIGGSAPFAKKKNYSKLLSLPFGNNGHASLGGAVGMTFDFVQFVEIGIETGITHFFAKNEYRPVPNSNLQRVVYPFWTQVKTQPGANWHVKALLNAYQFIHHVSFWATYELIEHQEDCFTICNNPIVYKTDPITGKTFQEYVFLPKQLSCCSDWRSQFINLGLIFDIQPGIQMAFLWQQPITPRNAYYPVSIMGTLTFLF